jgi:hypothetical protein
VPAPFAQATADVLVRSGILAIWNFAPVVLKVPSHIIVHNEDLYSSLAGLSFKLAKLLQARTQSSGLITINKQITAEQLVDEEDVSVTFDPTV